MVRITGIEYVSIKDVTLYCVHGELRLRGQKVLEVLGHTGIKFFPPEAQTSKKYVEQMLIGRLAKIDKSEFERSVFMNRVKLFTFKFRVEFLKNQKKKQ